MIQIGMSFTDQNNFHLFAPCSHFQKLSCYFEINQNIPRWRFRIFFQLCMMFGIPWSIGALIDPDGRAKFDKFFRDLIHGNIEEFPIPKSIGKIEGMFPENSTVYDFHLEVRYGWPRLAKIENSKRVDLCVSQNLTSLFCGAILLSGRTPDSQSSEPRFEFPFATISKISHFRSLHRCPS